MALVRIPDFFLARLRELSDGRRNYVIARLEWFQRNPNDEALRLRPLRSTPGHFIIDSVRWDRIILRLEDDGVYVAADCGGHEILDEWDRMAATLKPKDG